MEEQESLPMLQEQFDMVVNLYFKVFNYDYKAEAACLLLY